MEENHRCTEALGAGLLLGSGSRLTHISMRERTQFSRTRDPEELPLPAGSLEQVSQGHLASVCPPQRVSQGHLASVCPPVKWAVTETTSAASEGPEQGCCVGRYDDHYHHSLPPVMPEPSETCDHSPQIRRPSRGDMCPLGGGAWGCSQLGAPPRSPAV